MNAKHLVLCFCCVINYIQTLTNVPLEAMAVSLVHPFVSILLDPLSVLVTLVTTLVTSLRLAFQVKFCSKVLYIT